jgi:hypothetical protein
MTIERGSIVETRLIEEIVGAVPATLCEHARDANEACDK